ncbi:NTP/NDP exchange transporter [Mangrovimonas xylaniphaga]|uniref:NTP/NDP exchange transporter n=1 Tax=Mangrovimonas xylaniphaga TaxID=1645915 RepID=UPI0006B586EC|nr:Npt1/Npt2 family nucleotide transporter [Mangrovimonas xylaniphaga]
MPNTKGLKAYLLRVFDINEDELQKTLLLQLNIFLIVTTLLIVKPTINSIFLSQLTAKALPIGYILTAIFAIAGSYFYDKALEKWSLIKIINRTFLGSVLILILFGVALNLHLGLRYLLYIPYVFIAIYGLLTTSQFWLFANMLYNAREAKRVFGFIGAGAIAGGIAGGYITSLLSLFMPSEDLLFVAAALLFCCIPTTRYLWRSEIIKHHSRFVTHKTTQNGQSPLKLIKQSHLLSLLAIVIGISVIVAKLVDYQYNHYASELIENPEELTAFFGFWLSTLSVISLVIQLFFTKHIVGTFGVGKSLLWLPVGILFGSILLVFLPELWVIVLIKIADGSLKQSVNKAATELLVIPIPIDIKKKTKTFIDVVIDSIATGIAGFLLIFIINGLQLHRIYVSLLTIAFICAWIYFIFKVKKAYILAFRKLLDTSHPKSDKEDEPKPELPVTSIINSVKRVFEQGTESQILHMLNRTLEQPDERFFDAIKGLLNHNSPKVKALAIENLYFLKKEDLSATIEPLIYDPDQELTTNALRYIIHKNRKHPKTVFEKYINSEDESIKNAMLISLSLELQNKHQLLQKFEFENWLEKAIEEYKNSADPVYKKHKILSILEAIGHSKLKKYDYVLTSEFNNKDPEIANVAITSAGSSKSLDYVEAIVDQLSRKETRETAMEVLHNYGPSIIEVLVQKTLDEDLPIDDAHFIPSVIESFSSQQAVNGLIELIDTTEHAVTIAAIESLQHLKWEYPSLKIKDQFVVDKILDECHLYQSTLSSIHSQIILDFKEKSEHKDHTAIDDARRGLMRILEQRLDRQLHRIFKFLGIKYPPHEIEPILDIIINGEEEQRTNAIEFLDNVLDMHLKRELIPIAESVIISDKISEEMIDKLNLTVYSESECYKVLLQRHDIKIKHAVLYLIEKLNQKKFIPLIDILLNDQSKTVRQQAHTIKEQLQALP